MAVEIKNARLSDEPNKQGFWEIHYTEYDSDKPQGKKYRSKVVSTGRAIRHQAETFFKQWKKGLNAGLDVIADNNGRWDMNAVFAYYFENRKQRVSDVFECAQAQMAPFFGRMYPHEIEKKDLYEYQGKREISDASLIKEVKFMRAALNLACKDKKISAEDVPNLDISFAQNARLLFLHEDQKKEFLQLAASTSNGRMSRLHRFCYLALETGARRTSIENLLWTQVDFKTQMVNYIISGSQEHNKRRANVPIHSALMPVLVRAHSERINNYVLDDNADIYHRFERMVKGTKFAALPWTGRTGKVETTALIPHDLRKTFCSLLAMKGVPMSLIADLSGDSVQTIERYYKGLAPNNALRNAIEGKV